MPDNQACSTAPLAYSAFVFAELECSRLDQLPTPAGTLRRRWPTQNAMSSQARNTASRQDTESDGRSRRPLVSFHILPLCEWYGLFAAHRSRRDSFLHYRQRMRLGVPL